MAAMRISWILALVVAALPLASLADAAPPQRRARPRGELPKFALARLKRAVARRDAGAEWALLSPNFKRRLNRRLGRHVDLADYTHARQVQRRNSQVRDAEKALRGAKIQRVRRVAPGKVRMSVWMGGPLIFGQSVTVSLTYLARWELWVHGERQPYWGFARDPALSYTKDEEGNYTLISRNPRGRVIAQQMVPAHRVRSFRMVRSWYFDHLGELEQYIK